MTDNKISQTSGESNLAHVERKHGFVSGNFDPYFVEAQAMFSMHESNWPMRRPRPLNQHP